MTTAALSSLEEALLHDLLRAIKVEEVGHVDEGSHILEPSIVVLVVARKAIDEELVTIRKFRQHHVSERKNCQAVRTRLVLEASMALRNKSTVMWEGTIWPCSIISRIKVPC